MDFSVHQLHTKQQCQIRSMNKATLKLTETEKKTSNKRRQNISLRRTQPMHYLAQMQLTCFLHFIHLPLGSALEDQVACFH